MHPLANRHDVYEQPDVQRAIYRSDRSPRRPYTRASNNYWERRVDQGTFDSPRAHKRASKCLRPQASVTPYLRDAVCECQRRGCRDEGRASVLHESRRRKRRRSAVDGRRRVDG